MAQSHTKKKPLSSPNNSTKAPHSSHFGVTMTHCATAIRKSLRVFLTGVKRLSSLLHQRVYVQPQRRSGRRTTRAEGWCNTLRVVGDSNNMSIHNSNQVNATDSRTDNLSKSDVFHLLANDRRRLVLSVLIEQGPSTKRELIDNVARREFGVDNPPSDKRKRVHVSLYQCHLPKLEDYGVVEETRRDEYRLSVNAKQVTPYLDCSSRISKLKACL